MTEIKMAYYRKKDWKRFLKMIDDRESMHETWDDWHKDYMNARKSLASKGFEVFDVVIDLNELTNYCKSKGIKNDGNARSQFVQKN